jgi:polygalacturonase
MMRPLLIATVLPFLSQIVQAQDAKAIMVRNDAELRTALASLKEGAVLRIGPGDYSGGKSVSQIKNLTVEAVDAKAPPHFKGGTVAWQFSRCEHLTVRNLRVSGQSNNGINLDDGGVLDTPVVGVHLEGLHISDIGPKGNCDGIKASGLKKLTITNCQIHGWSGQGIDLVGCHETVISNCRITGKEGYNGSAGIQTKGGSADVKIVKCQFLNAGERPLNVGGSTGLPYFRPQGAPHEAKNISVEGCVIDGGMCAAAFVGVDGALFADNTVRSPSKWIFRILQETPGNSFVPCRNVRIENNRIVFQRSAVGSEVNIGSGTKAETFTFTGNHWFAEDRPDRSRPKLPVEETKGIYGTAPRTTK